MNTMSRAQKALFVAILTIALSSILHLWSKTPPDYMSTGTLFGVFFVVYISFLAYFVYASCKYAGWIRTTSIVMAVVCAVMAGYDFFVVSLGAM